MTNGEALRLCSDEQIAELITVVSEQLVNGVLDLVHIRSKVSKEDREKTQLIWIDWLKKEATET